MPIPDPYANEPTAEVDLDHYRNWLVAKDAVMKWQKEVKRLEELLGKQMGDASAGTVNGTKVITHRPQKNYAAAALRRDYPDLTAHFVKKTVVDEFQVDDFVAAHPDIAEPYRVRAFRMVVNADDDTM